MSHSISNYSILRYWTSFHIQAYSTCSSTNVTHVKNSQVVTSCVRNKLVTSLSTSCNNSCNKLVNKLYQVCWPHLLTSCWYFDILAPVVCCIRLPFVWLNSSQQVIPSPIVFYVTLKKQCEMKKLERNLEYSCMCPISIVVYACMYSHEVCLMPVCFVARNWILSIFKIDIF